MTTTILAKKVGNLEAIRISTKSTTTYRCSDVTIEIGHKSWVFDCDGVIACPDNC